MLVKNNYYDMKHLKKMNEKIEEMNFRDISGDWTWMTAQKLTNYINKLLEKINELEDRVKELEQGNN